MSSPAETVAAQESGKIFAEGDPWVLVVYFLAFGIWTAAAANDFISSTWRPVAHTRRRGKLHVTFVSIPMAFISVYVVFQHKAKDYKEMGAALLALAFAFLHLCRTFMGLWQLHIFKQWAVCAIKSMDSLDFERNNVEDVEKREEDPDYDTEDPDKELDGILKWLFSFVQWVQSHVLPYREQQGDIEKLVDAICVNETLLDNRLSDVHTVCTFRLLSVEEMATVREANSALKRLCLRYWYRLRNAPRLFQVLLSLFFSENPRMPNSHSGPRLVPRFPESVWLNWATALVAQAGWVIQGKFPMDPDPSAGYEQNRSRFMEQVLLSASLHTQRTTPAGGYLSFAEWHFYPELCKGKFSKQEWLMHACRTGNGLPYKKKHRKARESTGKRTVWGYGNFESELRRAREALLPELETRVENFGIEELEWFTIFVSVENWKTGSSSEENSRDVQRNLETGSYSEERSADAQEIPDTSQSPLNRVSAEDQMSTELVNDTPEENLKKQLGYGKKTEFILRHSELPFLNNLSKTVLWGNRNVLEVSCHIDIWLALCTGEQAALTLEHVPGINKNTCDGDRKEGNSDGLDRIVEHCTEFEKYRFMCQMAIVKPENFHFEKSASFLGCSMEVLRTSLAKWVAAQEESDEGPWKSELFSSGDKKRLVFYFVESSHDLTSCLRSLKTQSDMEKRYVKMRILWELQNILQKYLQEHGSTPSSVAAMATCILSFPAVEMDVREAEDMSGVRDDVQENGECCLFLGSPKEEPFRVQDYEYVIQSTFGPQDLQLILSFAHVENYSNFKVSMSLCEMEGGDVPHFDWEAWRNAFYGRLEACRRWKEKIGQPAFSLNRSLNPISTGMQKVSKFTTAGNLHTGSRAELLVWKGWVPHCSSICMYELTTDDFIMQPCQAKAVFLPVRMGEEATVNICVPQEILKPVEYSEATEISLRNASLVAQDLLSGDLRYIREEEEVGIAQRPGADPSLTPDPISALEEEIEALLPNMSEEEAVIRGVAMLERFYVYGSYRPGKTEQNTSNIFSFLCNKHFVHTVKSLFDKIFCASDYDMYVAERYQLFLMSLMRLEEQGTRENALQVMFRSIIYRCYSKDVAESAATIVASVLPFHSNGCFEEYAVLILAYSNAEDVDAAKKNLSTAIRTVARRQGGWRWLEAIGMSTGTVARLYKLLIQERGNADTITTLRDVVKEPKIDEFVEVYKRGIEEGKNDTDVGNDALGPFDELNENDMTTRAFLFSRGEGGVGQNIQRAVELYTVAIREKNDTHAMYNLALLLLKGDEDVAPDARRTVELVNLLNRSVEEADNVDAMNLLGELLLKGENGVEKDGPRAVDLFSRAISAGSHTGAMYNLGLLLSTGMEHVEKDIPRAVELLNRSVNEGDNVNAMNLLGRLLAKDGNGVKKDMRRAANLFSRAVEVETCASAMCSLASLLLTGGEGVLPDVIRAVELLDQSISRGDNFDAMNLLGELLCKGENGVERNGPRAVELFSRAITVGSQTGAMYNLGSLLSTGTEHVEKDISRAVELLKRSVEEGGNVDAMNLLGLLYYKGEDGVEKDGLLAVELFSRAIYAGSHTDAMYNLGSLLSTGIDQVEKDIARAVDLLKKSIEEGGNADAMSLLGLLLDQGERGMEEYDFHTAKLFSKAMYSRALLLCTGTEHVNIDIPRAMELLKRSVEEVDNVDAMNLLGLLYAKGESGVEKDGPRAVELFSSAISAGSHTGAMYNLGALLSTGTDQVEKDIARAVELLKRSVEEGDNVDAMNLLGLLHAKGDDGVEKNGPRAVELFSRAIDVGNCPSAMYSLAHLLCTGDEGVLQDVSRAVELLNRSIVRGGNIDAMNLLGLLYYKGEDGVEKDGPRAVELFSRAISAGSHTGAMYNLGSLFSTGTDQVEKDIARAMDLLKRSVEEGGNVDAMNLLELLYAEDEDNVERSCWCGKSHRCNV